ncbi:MAG: 1-acyl-sn-glycerol-3-phosphate acyltransferase [Gemmataceae bacterium]|nr:1-acyl-sn-glycerol-3-phosphate acyltransferase [Gemmataceae bacterium]
MSPWVATRWWEFWKLLVFPTVSTLMSLRYSGGQHVPRTGPVLFLSNHQSFLDPVLIGLSLPRQARFVHRQTLQNKKWLTWLMASLRGIPIDHRGFSREGLQATLDALECGESVAMFPEGERTHDGLLGEFKPGISLLIKRTKCPIIPIGIAGAFDAWPRTCKLPRLSPLFLTPSAGTVAVAIGKPIEPGRYEKSTRVEMLADLRREVAVQMQLAESLRRKRREAL